LASLTIAKFPFPIVFITRYLPICCTGSGRLALADLVALAPLDNCQIKQSSVNIQAHSSV